MNVRREGLVNLDMVLRSSFEGGVVASIFAFPGAEVRWTWGADNEAARGSWLAAFIVFGEEFAEAIELSFPGDAVIANPLLESAKACSFDAAGANAAELFSVHERGLFENLQVLGNGGERDAERFSKTRNGCRAADEAVEDRTARGISEGVEEAIDLLRLCGHVGFVSRCVGSAGS